MAVAVTHMTSIYANMKVEGWDITDLVKDPSSEEFSRFLRSIEKVACAIRTEPTALAPGDFAGRV